MTSRETTDGASKGTGQVNDEARASPRRPTKVDRGAAAAETDPLLLEVNDLRVWFDIDGKPAPVIHGVDLHVRPGEVVGLVGESGSGKSVSMRAVMGLLDRRSSRVKGSIRLVGRELIDMPERRLRQLRGTDVAMVFQDPMTSLNPVLTIGAQLVDTLTTHRSVNKAAARLRALELLDLVGIRGGFERLDKYPHEFSGGMRQRVLIAMAVSCEPSLLIADEATTALDVTMQAEILALLARLQAELGMAMLLITHDLGVVAGLTDRVYVMYSGRVVEQADVASLFRDPSHPYTQGLLAATPTLYGTDRKLVGIPGTPPSVGTQAAGCPFRPRCTAATVECATWSPVLHQVPARGNGAVKRPIAAEESARNTTMEIVEGATGRAMAVPPAAHAAACWRVDEATTPETTTGLSEKTGTTP